MRKSSSAPTSRGMNPPPTLAYLLLLIPHTCIRTRKKAEADYEDAKEQLEVESKLRAKLERDVKAQAKGGKDLQTAKAEADKLKARVTSLEKMEADYKRYVPLHLSFSLSTLLSVVLGCKLD